MRWIARRAAAPASADSLLWEVRAALKHTGCPICRVVAERERVYLFWFFNETYYEGGFRQRLTRAQGFCAAHGAWIVRGSPYIVAVVAQYILADTRVRLSKARAALASPRRRQGPTPTDAARLMLVPDTYCPACFELVSYGREQTRRLAEALSRHEWAERYMKSDGLCFPHLCLGLESASPVAARVLLDHAEKCLHALAHDVDEYLRKTNYIYAHEPKGAEQDSWFRAMEYLSGRRYRRERD